MLISTSSGHQSSIFIDTSKQEFDFWLIFKVIELMRKQVGHCIESILIAPKC